MKNKINLLICSLIFTFFVPFVSANAVDSQVYVGARSSTKDSDDVLVSHKGTYETQLRILFDLNASSRDTHIQAGPFFAYQYGKVQKSLINLRLTDAQFGLGFSFIRSLSSSVEAFFDVFYIPYSIGSLYGYAKDLMMLNGQTADSTLNIHFYTSAFRLGLGPSWNITDKLSALVRYELGFEKHNVTRYQYHFQNRLSSERYTGSKESIYMRASTASVSHAFHLGVGYNI